MSGPELYAEIARLSREVEGRVVEVRRAIHRRPGLGFDVEETACLVEDWLRGLGLRPRRMAGTGVVADLVMGDGPSVGSRSDMDALPLTERTNLPFASEIPGRMHACGHDANTAINLGAAAVLARLAGELSGRVRFVFQPCEEVPPGGARAMIEEGVLLAPPLEAMFGVHVDTSLPTGLVGLRKGTLNAAAEEFRLELIGRGGHGAFPHEAVDAIVIAAEAVLSLQTIASRRIDPLRPVVLSLGTIHGGEQFNIIPERVEMTGTIRALDEATRRRVREELERTVQGVASAHGGACKLEFHEGYPPLVNDAGLFELALEAVGRALGREAVALIERPNMGGEDFAFFCRAVPSFMMLVGCRDEACGAVHPWHHPEFRVDEAALPVGVAALAAAIAARLAAG